MTVVSLETLEIWRCFINKYIYIYIYLKHEFDKGMYELNKYKKKKQVIEGEIPVWSTYFWSEYVREFTKF